MFHTHTKKLRKSWAKYNGILIWLAYVYSLIVLVRGSNYLNLLCLLQYIPEWHFSCQNYFILKFTCMWDKSNGSSKKVMNCLHLLKISVYNGSWLELCRCLLNGRLFQDLPHAPRVFKRQIVCTNSMDKSPWEVSLTANEIPCLLWNLKAQFCVCKSLWQTS
jgi:hypothetical protein